MSSVHGSRPCHHHAVAVTELEESEEINIGTETEPDFYRIYEDCDGAIITRLGPLAVFD